jgi:hypothetical protein
MHVVRTEYPALKVSGIITQVSKATHLTEDDRLHIVCYWWGGGGEIKVKNLKLLEAVMCCVLH